MRRISEWLATMPSTNARIAVTLLVVLGTSARYWSSASWVPSSEWLMFLAAMSASDGAVFYLKRRTHTEKNGGASPPSGASS